MDDITRGDNTDQYLEQLWQVFHSCDTGHCGFLNRRQLLALCNKLHFTDQGALIVDQLLQHTQDDVVS